MSKKNKSAAEFSDETLAAYLAGEQPLPEDADWRAALADLRLAEFLLNESEPIEAQPDYDEWVRVAAGLATPAEKQRLEAILAQHPALQAEWQALARLSGERAQPGWLVRLQQQVETLLLAWSEPAGQPALALRGRRSQVTRYQAPPFTIAISTGATDDGLSGWEVEGQLLQAGQPVLAATVTVSLMAGEEKIQETALDALGSFAFYAVSDGVYGLILEYADATIVIEQLAVP